MLSNYPDFLAGFACKRGACRRTCCRHDWNVVMSAKEYRKATDESLPEGLRALARAHVRPNPRSTGESDYGFVEMVGDVPCPMLDDGGLCRWRALAGNHICSTCESFPCTCLSFLGQEYLMPSGGCEAVLEALVGREEPIHMVSADVPDNNLPKRVYHELADERRAEARPLLRHYPALVGFGLDVLQDRSLPLDERVARLMEALAHVDYLERSGQVDALPELLARLSSLTARRRPCDDAKTHGGDSDARPDGGVTDGRSKAAPWLAVFVCGEVFSHYCHDSAHAPTASRILDGLGVSVREVPDADGVTRWQPVLSSKDAYARGRVALGPWLEQWQTFLEHVSVCLFLKTLTPIRGSSVWESAVYLASLYATVKGGLVGYFVRERPTEERVVDVLVEVIRMGTHSELVRPTICSRMAQVRFDGLPQVEALVRA